MFKFKSCLALGLLCVALNVNAAAADDKSMIPPKPLENKVYDAMVGTWHAESENLMHKKMRSVLKVRWGLGHQFLIVELKATRIDNPKMKYEGLGLFGIDKDGKAKTFWFDNWGVDAMSTGTGEFSDGKLMLTDKNATFKETRSFEVKGNEMFMHAKGTMILGGKETPFDQEVVYKRG